MKRWKRTKIGRKLINGVMMTTIIVMTAMTVMTVIVMTWTMENTRRKIKI